MKIKAQGHTFQFEIHRLRRGCWVYRLIVVDDEPQFDYGSDPEPTERACRALARNLAENGKHHPVYGWCLS